jgi:hypothetical protein
MMDAHQNLVHRLSPVFPGLDRLTACEQELLRTERGRRVVENFLTSLENGFVTAEQFTQFCNRLGELVPASPAGCDSGALQSEIDHPHSFYCQGPPVDAAPAAELSQLMDLPRFLYALSGRRPNDGEISDARESWRLRQEQGLGSARHRLTLRGRRPFFWAVPTDGLRAAVPLNPNRLRDLLGLSHIKNGYLLELRFLTAQVGALHRPTVLDALDHPTFYPAVGPGGWGVTDDLNGPRPTPGLPEAVAPAADLECEVDGHGDVTPSNRSF